MKKLLLMFAAVAVFFTACTEECNHEFIEVDYSKDLVGTWTTLEVDHAAAYIFKGDGTVSTTGLDKEGQWEDVKGTYNVVNNKITMKFESGHNIEGSFDIIPGQTFSFADKTGRHTYQYCKEDLSEEIVGMWVWVDSKGVGTANMGIQTFNADGTAMFTGGYEEIEYKVNKESTYKVIGDLLIQNVPDQKPSYMVRRLTFIADATTAGDILTTYSPETNYTASWLRIKQDLELAGNKYDYIKTFVTNVKGEDKDIPFLNTSFNFAKMDGSIIDKFLKSILFTVEFPDANTIKYSYLLEGQNIVIEAPVAVEANKMTIKMSENEKTPFYKDIDVYTFQDQDNTQMHMYMHTTSFEKFFANTAVAVMLGNGQLDATDAEAIEGVYKTIADAVESINLSLVMTKTK